jgi:DNA-binding NtrC family response regulator
VQAEDVRPLLEGAAAMRGVAASGPGAAGDGADVSAAAGAAASVRSLDDMERDAIVSTLARFDGNRTAAAHALGISVRKLQYKIKEYQQAGIVIE